MELADEMDRFYGAIGLDRDVRLQQMQDALFGERPKAYAQLAWEQQRLVGFASYSFLWRAEGMTTSLYLKELYS